MPNPNPWVEISKELPPIYLNVLLAFDEHWNQIVGFYCGKKKDGKMEFYETSAHKNNSAIKKPYPKWWARIPQVPHHPYADAAVTREREAEAVGTSDRG